MLRSKGEDEEGFVSRFVEACVVDDDDGNGCGSYSTIRVDGRKRIFRNFGKRSDGFVVVSRKGPGFVCEPSHLIWLSTTKRRGGWFTMVAND